MALSTQKTTDIQKQFDPMRRRLQQQEAANLQQQKDAMARRQAQLGGGPSGAFVKQEQLANDASARRLQDANEGVDAQQTAALNQARDVQEQRDWQTGERVAGQDFASGQALQQRNWQTGEREAGQVFTAQESAMARELQRYGIDVNKVLQEGALTGQYNGQDTVAQNQLELAQNQYNTGLSQYGDAMKQQEFENKINTGTTLATLMGNLKTLGYSPDQVNSVLSGLGLEKLPGIDVGSIQGVTAAPPPPPGPQVGTTGKDSQGNTWKIGPDGKPVLVSKGKSSIFPSVKSGHIGK
jgi:hypothetical protein